jgi:hypothetical protein
MNTPDTKSPWQNVFNFLIVDDSDVVRTQLSRSIARVCGDLNKPCEVYQYNRSGQLVKQPPLTGALAVEDALTCYRVFTASSHKTSVKIIDGLQGNRLTIISDISIPQDTEVGLLGFLEALSYRQLAVNLIFMSNEYQNRANIEPLLKRGKAYFVEKGSDAFVNLPDALVQRVDNFRYQVLTMSDFSVPSRTSTAPAFLEKLAQATVAAQPQPQAVVAQAVRPAPTLTVPKVAPVATPAPEPEPKTVKERDGGTARLRLPNIGGLAANGTAKLREIPELFKKVPFPHIRKKPEEGDRG